MSSSRKQVQQAQVPGEGAAGILTQPAGQGLASPLAQQRLLTEREDDTIGWTVCQPLLLALLTTGCGRPMWGERCQASLLHGRPAEGDFLAEPKPSPTS